MRRDDPKNEEKSQKDYGNYGYYNTSGNSFYSRTYNEYNLNRATGTVPTSTSRPARNSESEANKSSVGDHTTLQEEQAKRSKLEAENTKSKVENTELKNKLS